MVPGHSITYNTSMEIYEDNIRSLQTYIGPKTSRNAERRSSKMDLLVDFRKEPNFPKSVSYKFSGKLGCFGVIVLMVTENRVFFLANSDRTTTKLQQQRLALMNETWLL